jgi:signal-transduction protein with cAMP-binding, CBS, and nucleotidyltransferase domain
MTKKERRPGNRSRRAHPMQTKSSVQERSGISNQALEEERATQSRVPPRRNAGEPGWTRTVQGHEGDELMAQTVADLMTPQPTALEAAQAVADAARVMRDADIGNILVTDEGRLVGTLTDRDLVVRVLAERLDPESTPVGVVCSRRLTTLSPGDAVDAAVARMREEAVRRLPVVEDGRAVGILALGDLVIERDPESILGTVSAAPATPPARVALSE